MPRRLVPPAGGILPEGPKDSFGGSFGQFDDDPAPAGSCRIGTRQQTLDSHRGFEYCAPFFRFPSLLTRLCAQSDSFLFTLHQLYPCKHKFHFAHDMGFGFTIIPVRVISKPQGASVAWNLRRGHFGNSGAIPIVYPAQRLATSQFHNPLLFTILEERRL